MSHPYRFGVVAENKGKFLLFLLGFKLVVFQRPNRHFLIPMPFVDSTMNLADIFERRIHACE